MEFVGSELNPLYSQGFDRVGCFPCLAGMLGKLKRLVMMILASRSGLLLSSLRMKSKNVFVTKAYGSKIENADLMVQTKRKTKLEHDDLFDAPPCMLCQI